MSIQTDPRIKAPSLEAVSRKTSSIYWDRASEFSSKLRGEARDRASQGQSEMTLLASDVAVAELVGAAKRNDAQACAHWGALCATSGALDQREANHVSGNGELLLSAPPLWFAVYREDHALTLQLLRAGADPDACSTACGGGCQCPSGGLSALHVAIMRGSASCVSCLLSLKAAPNARMCFGYLKEEDEPEWDDETAEFVGGLSGISALQYAAQTSRSTSDALSLICRALITQGADSSSLRAHEAAPSRGGAAPSAAMAPLLRALTTSEGDTIDCPICLAEVLTLNSVFTPCCIKPFHAHCLKSQAKCPMCRTPLPDKTREDVGMAASISAGGGRAAADEQGGSGVSRLDVFMQQSNAERREAALALAFDGAAFHDGAMPTTLVEVRNLFA